MTLSIKTIVRIPLCIAWTEAEDKILLKMLYDSKPYADIALCIDRTQQACRGRFKLLRTRGATQKPVTRRGPKSGDGCCEPSMIAKASAKFVADGLRIYGCANAV